MSYTSVSSAFLSGLFSAADKQKRSNIPVHCLSVIRNLSSKASGISNIVCFVMRRHTQIDSNLLRLMVVVVFP